MFLRKKKAGPHTYLQLVENRRVDGKVRQRVLLSLGRLDRLQQNGQIDRLLRSAARLSQVAGVIAARQAGPAVRSRSIGPALVFDRLWRRCGGRSVVRAALAGRRFRFDVERAVWLTVLHRLFEPGSDRQADRWAAGLQLPGAEQLQLHHLYRAMAWLGEPLPKQPKQSEQSERQPGERQPAPEASAAQPAAAQPPDEEQSAEQRDEEQAEPPDEEKRGVEAVPRCVKDELEEALFARRRNLFTGLDLVFFDTTSHYFHGAGGKVLGQRGKSKDYRPQCRQVVVGLALDSEGRPLCTEIWPGNTADVTTLLPVADRLQERFGVPSACLVADRGMVSRATREELEERGWGYLLGCRMRTLKEFREQVLADGEADGVERLDEEVLKLERQGRREPLQLAVREVRVGPSGGGPGSQRRYVLCRNEEQARRDRAVREAILEQLRPKVKQGGKRLVGNRGYRRYLKSGPQAFELDEDKIRAEERYDGLWALQVHGPLTAAEAAVKYKELWRVERCFREAKSLLRTRPVYHRTDEAIRGHIFCSYLALLLKGELQRLMERAGVEVEWADVIRGLKDLREDEVRTDGKRFALRTEVRQDVVRVLRCAGVKLPPAIRLLEPEEGA